MHSILCIFNSDSVLCSKIFFYWKPFRFTPIFNGLKFLSEKLVLSDIFCFSEEQSSNCSSPRCRFLGFLFFLSYGLAAHNKFYINFIHFDFFWKRKEKKCRQPLKRSLLADKLINNNNDDDNDNDNNNSWLFWLSYLLISRRAACFVVFLFFSFTYRSGKLVEPEKAMKLGALCACDFLLKN